MTPDEKNKIEARIVGGRTLLVEGDVARVPLTKGMFALIDVADIAIISRYIWSASLTGKNKNKAYAQTTDEHGKTLSMHRCLMGFVNGDGRIVDHINGDGLDNRRANLREVTERGNGANRRKYSGRTSRYKGVSWSAAKQRWAGQAIIDGEKRSLGYFDSDEAAAISFDMHALREYGETAWLNFPDKKAEYLERMQRGDDWVKAKTKRYSKEQREWICDLYTHGESCRDIATTLGLKKKSWSVVKNILVSCGIELRPPGRTAASLRQRLKQQLEKE